MVYRMKDIPHASSPVIRPRFSFGGSKSPSFNFGVANTARPHFRIGEDLEDMDDTKKNYMIAVLVCVVVSIIYCYKYKPEKVMDMSDSMNPVVSPKLVLIYFGLPAILAGMGIGYIYENYIQE